MLSIPIKTPTKHTTQRSIRISITLLCSVWALNFSCTSEAAKLEPYARISGIGIRECSGIAKSRQTNDIYWVHNDSSSGSRIFAILKDGSLVAAFPTGLTNIDWEDVATDNSGNLYLGDFGNFLNTRRDLAIHFLKEPLKPKVGTRIKGTTYRFEYPEQTEFPPRRRIYDCEAIFWAQEELFLLTKSLGDTATRLYCFESLRADEINHPKLVGEFDIGPRVTGADATPDGKRLAVLTTSSVWVFERPENSRNYLEGIATTLRISAGQCEAICWDDQETLIIANEDRALFEVKVADLVDY